MAVDEYEAIRLIDLAGLTQEECAEQMGVARTTAQAIYTSARKKLAECIVEGRQMLIYGGDVQYCEQSRDNCCRCCFWREAARKKQIGERNLMLMRIAVTYEDGNVYQHFGHSRQFKLYDVAEGKVQSTSILDTNSNGHGALAGLLKQEKADTLICGGIGGGAKQALAAAGIQIFGGVTGNADQAVEAMLAGKLAYDPAAQCSHHAGQHADEHHCGSHCSH
jgi:predicted Fe-Mo cluster-binding NifX family protein